MEDVTVEADGSTTFQSADAGGGQEEAFAGDDTAGAEDTFAGAGEEEVLQQAAKSIDPAIYLLIIVVLCVIGFVLYQRKKKEEDEDDFFSNLDGEKVRLFRCTACLHVEESIVVPAFGVAHTCTTSHLLIKYFQFNLKLPAEVEEYYTIRAKCEAAGWKPGMVS
jgi:hypothetical protein